MATLLSVLNTHSGFDARTEDSGNGKQVGTEVVRQHPLQGELPLPTTRAPSPEEQALKREQHRLWRQEIRDWLVVHPFTAQLVMRLELVMVVDARVPTACTDGTHIFVNAHFAARCDIALRRFVMGHELYHVLLGHFTRQYGRDRLRWNLAVDAEVNYRLMLDGLPLPSDAVIYPSRAGRSAEAIYGWLQGHPNPEVDTPFDDHGVAGLPTPRGHHTAPQPVDPDFAPKAHDSHAARQLTQQWQAEVVRLSQSRAPGTTPGGMALLVKEVTAPRVNWRHVLHQFLQQLRGGALTWNRLNRRQLGQGRYLQGQQNRRLSLMVVIDTSASTQRDLPMFLAEIQGVLASTRSVVLHLIECDAAIQRERVITHVEQLQEVNTLGQRHWRQARGGGGTSFMPVFERAAELMPEGLLVFTDGYGEAPQQPPACPVVWAITRGGQPPVSWGQVIRMEAA